MESNTKVLQSHQAHGHGVLRALQPRSKASREPGTTLPAARAAHCASSASLMDSTPQREGEPGHPTRHTDTQGSTEPMAGGY